MGMGGQRHASDALLRERSRAHCIGSWVALRDGLDRWDVRRTLSIGLLWSFARKLYKSEITLMLKVKILNVKNLTLNDIEKSN